jgi:hypothetical protein
VLSIFGEGLYIEPTSESGEDPKRIFPAGFGQSFNPVSSGAESHFLARSFELSFLFRWPSRNRENRIEEKKHPRGKTKQGRSGNPDSFFVFI